MRTGLKRSPREELEEDEQCTGGHYVSRNVDPNEVIVFGESKNDESSFLNSKLLDMLEGEDGSDHSSAEQHEESTANVPVSNQQSVSNSRTDRPLSKKKLRKSTSKKRASQNQKPRGVGLQKSSMMSTMLNDLIQKNRGQFDTTTSEKSRQADHISVNGSPSMLSQFSPNQSPDVSLTKLSSKTKPLNKLNMMECSKVDALLSALPENSQNVSKIQHSSRNNDKIPPQGQIPMSGFRSLASIGADTKEIRQPETGGFSVQVETKTQIKARPNPTAIVGISTLLPNNTQAEQPLLSERKFGTLNKKGAFQKSRPQVHNTPGENQTGNHGPLKSSRVATIALLDQPVVPTGITKGITMFTTAIPKTLEDLPQTTQERNSPQNNEQCSGQSPKRDSPGKPKKDFSRQSSASHRGGDGHTPSHGHIRVHQTLDTLIKERADHLQNNK